MSRSRVKDTAVKGYIRLPKNIRKHTDQIIQNRGIYAQSLDSRAEKGKKIVKNRLIRMITGKQRKRR